MYFWCFNSWESLSWKQRAISEASLKAYITHVVSLFGDEAVARPAALRQLEAELHVEFLLYRGVDLRLAVALLKESKTPCVEAFFATSDVTVSNTIIVRAGATWPPTAVPRICDTEGWSSRSQLFRSDPGPLSASGGCPPWTLEVSVEIFCVTVPMNIMKGGHAVRVGQCGRPRLPRASARGGSDLARVGR